MIWAPILLSVRTALLATVFSSLFGTALAFVLTRKSIPLRNLWETLITLPMILPPSVLGYLLLLLLGKRGPVGRFLLAHFGVQLIFTWGAAVIAAAIVSLPLMYQNAKAAFLSVEPLYEQAARTLGARNSTVFFTVTLPLAKNGLISGIVLAFARALGEFGATLMVAGNIPGKTQTIPTAIYFAVEGGRQDVANRLVLFMVVFSFAVIFGLNRWLQKRGRSGKRRRRNGNQL